MGLLQGLSRSALPISGRRGVKRSVASTSIREDQIPSPEEFLGFRVGDDRKLAGWSHIVDYFQVLGGRSQRVRVDEIGKSTEGNPFIVATISSPDTISELDRHLESQQRLADPRTLDEQAAAELIESSKVVVMVACSIHAVEVGASQMSMLLAHRLASGDDPDVARILDNVILLLVPSLNPDGLITVKRWYDATIGTEYEGVNPPFLYHRYAGHDNNRDWFMFTQAETRLVVEHCLNRWHPQIVLDLHQTRSTGMRMILPPLVDPIGPNVDPVLQSQLTMLGSYIASELTTQGKAGVAMNVVYDGYSPSRSYPHYHGGIRLLSEVAGARIATPVSLSKDELKPSRGESPTTASWNHPLPWKGGRWGLDDIVEYHLAAATACLNNAARNRSTWVRSSYEVRGRAVTAAGNPSAYLVPEAQADPNTAVEMLALMRTADVEVHEATAPFTADGRTFPTGTRVIKRLQPNWAFAKTMLETQSYADLREFPGGPPKEPYDATAHSLPIQMGVSTVAVKASFDAELRSLDVSSAGRGAVRCHAGGRPVAYLMSPNTNASVRAINRLLAAGARVERCREPFEAASTVYQPGTFCVAGGERLAELIAEVAERESLTFDAVSALPDLATDHIHAPRVGIYKSYVPNPEEGWTRFVLEEYGFSHRPLLDSDVRAGSLRANLDCVVLPHQRTRQLERGQDPSSYPEEYTGGLGDAGAKSLRAFVEEGGTLVTWDGAARYAIHRLDLPVSNALACATRSEFFAPGSLLRVELDIAHPIAYGMPATAAAMSVSSPAFDVSRGSVVARYPAGNPLLSGWLIGAERIEGKAALVDVPMGKGRVILIGFRPHFRAQARGTYRILFNSLLYSSTGR